MNNPFVIGPDFLREGVALGRRFFCHSFATQVEDYARQIGSFSPRKKTHYKSLQKKMPPNPFEKY